MRRILKRTLGFMNRTKKWWLVPLLIAAALVWALRALSIQLGPQTPFAYSLF